MATHGPIVAPSDVNLTQVWVQSMLRIHATCKCQFRTWLFEVARQRGFDIDKELPPIKLTVAP